MRDKAKIAFVLSHACPLKCNFCCSTPEVVGHGRLSRELMETCLIRFSRETAVTNFGFTGGDPFLYIDDIKSALVGARAAGVTQPFQMTTSAFWAKNAEDVRRLVAALKELGLSRLTLSYDYEHAKWVTPDQIRMVCDAAESLGVAVQVSGTFWNDDERVQHMLPALVGHTHVTLYNRTVAPVGRARHNSAWPRRYAVPLAQKFSCGDPGYYTFAVYPDGEVYPCCSTGFQMEGKLSCGNVHRDEPAHILFAGMTNFHVRLAKEFGWEVLYALVAREAPELVARLPRFDDVDSPCEICRDLNLTLREELAPIYHLIELEYAKARAEQEWHTGSGENGDTRRIGERVLSRPDFLTLIQTDRGTRLDYLAGVLQIGVKEDASEIHSVGPA